MYPYCNRELARSIRYENIQDGLLTFSSLAFGIGSWVEEISEPVQNTKSCPFGTYRLFSKLDMYISSQCTRIPPTRVQNVPRSRAYVLVHKILTILATPEAFNPGLASIHDWRRFPTETQTIMYFKIIIILDSTKQPRAPLPAHSLIDIH